MYFSLFVARFTKADNNRHKEGAKPKDGMKPKMQDYKGFDEEV